MNGGMARSNTTESPGSSTSQPMIRSVSGQSFSAEPAIRATPWSPLLTIPAAAPSPNKAVATMAAGSSLSRRIEIEQVSTVTNSQRVPGSAAASREASASPLTPPAQPRPKTGMRRTLSRKPMRPATRASRLGVAIPVVETVTTPSISSAASPAFAMAVVAASMNSCSAASR